MMPEPIFLDLAVIRATAAYANLDDATTAQLMTLAQRIHADADLYDIAARLYAHTYPVHQGAVEPAPESYFGDDAGLLYLLIALDAVRQLRIVQQSYGIPEAIIRASSHAPSSTSRRYALWRHDQPGLEGWILSWFSLVATGSLYRLGRMEYLLKPCTDNVRVYRHRATGRVQALAEAGVSFTAKGFIYKSDPNPAWTSALQVDAHSVTGTPISPLGYARRDPVPLALAEWELLLANGDTVIDMHIPNWAPLTLDLLRDSLEQALAFFPRYFPDQPFKAFRCASWIFNTQLADWLPPHSNLLAFQRQGYLYPLVSSGKDGLYFVFGSREIDLTTAPRDTQLRRAIVDHLAAGGRLRGGGFLLLPEEVGRFGQQPYRGMTR